MKMAQKSSTRASKKEDVSTTNDSMPSIGADPDKLQEAGAGEMATSIRGAVKAQADHVKAQMDGGYTKKLGAAGKIKQEIVKHMRDAHAQTQAVMDDGFHSKLEQIRKIQRDTHAKVKDAQMRMHHVMVPASGKEVQAQQKAQMAQQQLAGAVQDKMGGANDPKRQGVVQKEDTLDELSKDTLNSYKGKATKSAISSFMDARRGDLFSSNASTTLKRRKEGMKAADRKLNRKESATGHVGNEGGDGAHAALGSSSAPMESKNVVVKFAEAVKVNMRSMKEDEPGFSDGSSAGAVGRAGISTKPDVRKGALYSEDDDGAYQMVKNPPGDDGAANEIADKGWYAEKAKKKIDMRSKEFRAAAKKAAERAAKRASKKKIDEISKELHNRYVKSLKGSEYEHDAKAAAARKAGDTAKADMHQFKRDKRSAAQIYRRAK